MLSATSFLTVFDGQLVSVALPAIERGLALVPADAQWVITSYTIPLAGLLLFAGRVGDAIGHRRALMLGLALFAAGLAGAGLAPGIAVLAAFRVIQGAGAAFAAPASFACIGASFDAVWRPRVFAAAPLAGSAAAVAGMPLGGLVTVMLGWSWIFFLSVPVALAALAAARWALAETPRQPGMRRADAGGAALATGGIAATVFALTAAPRYGIRSPATAAGWAVAITLLGGFTLRQVTAAEPLVRPYLLRLRSLRAGMAGMAGVDFAFNAAFLIGVISPQQARGLSALMAGLGMVPLGAAAALGGPWSARLLRRHRASRIAAAGLAMTGAGLAGIAVIPVGAGYAAGRCRAWPCPAWASPWPMSRSSTGPARRCQRTTRAPVTACSRPQPTVAARSRSPPSPRSPPPRSGSPAIPGPGSAWPSWPVRQRRPPPRQRSWPWAGHVRQRPWRSRRV